MKYGTAIIALRKQRNISQKTLADKLNIFPQQLGDYENDKVSITANFINNLCKICNISEGDFFNLVRDLEKYKI